LSAWRGRRHSRGFAEAQNPPANPAFAARAQKQSRDRQGPGAATRRGRYVEVEIRINGNTELRLTPQTELDAVALRDVGERVRKGQLLDLAQEDGTTVLRLRRA